MGDALDEFLAGTKAEKVVDAGDFAPFKGFYACKIEELIVKPPTEYVQGFHYNLQLRVVETLDGDAADNRTLRRNYLKEPGKAGKGEDKKIGNLMDDLFTWGIELPQTNVDAFEAAFPTVKDSIVHVRAYHFSPKDSTEKFQLWVAKAKGDMAKIDKKAGDSPF